MERNGIELLEGDTRLLIAPGYTYQIITGRPTDGVPYNWGMNSMTKNTYNIAYDEQNDMLYFTYCSPEAEQLSLWQ